MFAVLLRSFPGVQGKSAIRWRESPAREWERVEKLEKILHAEDAARAGAEDARAASTATVSEARAKVAETLRVGREDICVNAEAYRDEVVARARETAAQAAEAATAHARSVIADATPRAETALDAVLRVLKGL